MARVSGGSHWASGSPPIIDGIYAEGWSNISEHLAMIPLSFSLFHCFNLASEKVDGRRDWEVQNGGKNKLNGALQFKSIIKGSGYILKSTIYFFRNLFLNKDVNNRGTLYLFPRT